MSRPSVYKISGDIDNMSVTTWLSLHNPNGINYFESMGIIDNTIVGIATYLGRGS